MFKVTAGRWRLKLLSKYGVYLFDDLGEAKQLQERLPKGIVCQKLKIFVAVMQQEVVAFVSLGTL